MFLLSHVFIAFMKPSNELVFVRNYIGFYWVWASMYQCHSVDFPKGHFYTCLVFMLVLILSKQKFFQWNLLIADISLQQALFFVTNEITVKLLITKPLCTGHFMDIIFRSRFTLTPRTDLSIADTPNSRLYKTFVRILYFFTIDNLTIFIFFLL